MLSNLIADFALKRARTWMDRHDAAEKQGDIVAEERALDHAEFWDDVRMWIDHIAPWRSLRAAREATRELEFRRGRPFVDMPIVEARRR